MLMVKPPAKAPHYIRELRKQRKMGQEQLAELSGVTAASISQIETGKQGMSESTLYAVAEALGVTVPDLFRKPGNAPLDVPLIGYVGAGATAHYYGDSPGELDRVAAPSYATKETVAVEIRGDSMGPLLNRWLVYYDEVRSPVTENLIGILCVVGLADERVLVKKILRTPKAGLFDLQSNTGEPLIKSVAIVWAARVRGIEPR
jgi:transcriptional regulator with XRE-family HTH domain